MLVHNNVKTEPEVSSRPLPAAFNCLQCDQTFKNESKMKAHLKSVHNVMSAFACLVCGVTFATATAMRCHLENVHEPFKCKVCSKPFTEKRMMLNHISKRYKDSIHDFRCQFCHRSANNLKHFFSLSPLFLPCKLVREH